MQGNADYACDPNTLRVQTVYIMSRKISSAYAGRGKITSVCNNNSCQTPVKDSLAYKLKLLAPTSGSVSQDTVLEEPIKLTDSNEEIAEWIRRFFSPQ